MSAGFASSCFSALILSLLIPVDTSVANLKARKIGRAPLELSVLTTCRNAGQMHRGLKSEGPQTKRIGREVTVNYG